MTKIFIGFIFIFLDFNLNLDSAQIGLIPDFIGYIVMGNGLIEMAGESPFFGKVKPYATGMAIYTGILYFMDLVGISVSLGALSFLLAVASVILSLYISYHIVLGVKEMEDHYGTFLNGSSLKSTWTLLAVCSAATFAALLIPELAILCIIVTFIAAICFLVAFNRSRNLYYEMKERAVPAEKNPEETE